MLGLAQMNLEVVGQALDQRSAILYTTPPEVLGLLTPCVDQIGKHHPWLPMK